MTTYFTRFKPFFVPSAYTFVDPDTGHKYNANTKQELFYAVVSYREQNELKPIAALDTVLDHYWCSLPENRGKCERVPIKRGWLQYISGGIVLLEKIYYGADQLLSPIDAQKRASICIKCTHNVFPDKDGFIKWSDALAEASTGGLRCKSHEDLGNCELCSCPLKCLVFYKKAGATEEEVEKLPEYCWKLNKE